MSGLAYESSHSGYVKILGKFAHGYELPGPIIDVEFFWLNKNTAPQN